LRRGPVTSAVKKRTPSMGEKKDPAEQNALIKRVFSSQSMKGTKHPGCSGWAKRRMGGHVDSVKRGGWLGQSVTRSTGDGATQLHEKLAGRGTSGKGRRKKKTHPAVHGNQAVLQKRFFEKRVYYRVGEGGKSLRKND